MVFVDDGGEVAIEQDLAVDVWIGVRRSESKCNVEVVFQEFVDEPRHVGVHHVDFDARIHLEKIEHRLAHHAAERIRDANIQFARLHILQVVELLLALLRIVDGLDGEGQQQSSRLGEQHLTAVALKKRLLQFLFQAHNLLCNCALRHKKFFCRSRKIESFGHLDKVFELSEFHYCVFTPQNYTKKTTRQNINHK